MQLAAWFQSFLTGRRQLVKIGQSVSNSLLMPQGVHSIKLCSPKEQRSRNSVWQKICRLISLTIEHQLRNSNPQLLGKFCAPVAKFICHSPMCTQKSFFCVCKTDQEVIYKISEDADNILRFTANLPKTGISILFIIKD